MKPSIFLYAALANMALAAPSGKKTDQTILVGSYTSSIYTLKLSTVDKNARLSLVSNNPTGSSAPSWLSRGPDASTILTCYEVGNAMQTFDFDAKTGKLAADSDPVETVTGPSYCAMTADKAHAIALGYTNGGHTLASYKDGKLEALPVEYADDDPLKPVPQNDTTSTHPHMFIQHPSLPLMYVVNLAQNAVHTYEFKDQKLSYKESLDVPGGPRHVQINAAGTLAWVITEKSSEVVPLSIAEDGRLDLNGDRGALTESGKVKGAGGEILLTADEKYIVASNRQVEGDQNDFLTTFEVKEDGKLGAAQYTDTKGQKVRGMAFNDDSSLLVLGNGANDTIAVYSRESCSGALTIMTDLFNIKDEAKESTAVGPSAFLWV